MKKTRLLDVKRYISELMHNGKIDDYPYVRSSQWGHSGHPLPVIHVIEKCDHFFIAEQRFGDETTRTEVGPMAKTIEEEKPLFEFRLAYFPTNLEHADIFSRSDVKPGGPQYELPGSVAMLGGYCNNRMLCPEFLQYCFIQGSPRELTRSLASKYIGARYHLLRAMFNVSFMLTVDYISLPEWLASSQHKKDSLERVIRENEGALSRFRRGAVGSSRKGEV